MKYRILAFLVLISLPFILESCVTKKRRNETGAVGKFYHNTTAYYNGYWNANEILKESMQMLSTANVDDYNQILEVEDYVSIDNPKMVKGEMDKIIEKVTTVAQLHEPSDWVDDCYVMMAKAQYLKQEYETAEETLEYFQEDFNPTNPYGRNYKSKKLTGKAAKNAKDLEAKEKAKAKKIEKEKKEEEKKQITAAKEDEKKAAAKLKEIERENKEAVKKAETKSREQKKKEAEKERERVKKEKEQQRKEDAKNRKKGIKTNTTTTKSNQIIESPKTEEKTIIQPKTEPATKTENIEPKKKEIAKTSVTPEKQEAIAENTVVKKEKPQVDETAYSEGLLWLAKTYIKRENWFSAEMLLQKLSNSAINEDIKSELPATYANLYIKQKNYDKAIPKLLQAINEESNNRLKSRYAYIAAQLYNIQNDNIKALEYYTIAKKYARSPKLEFMAQLAIAKTSIQSGNRSKPEVLSDLKDMLKDVKNNDVRDQIFFTIAEIELSQNNDDLAIENFRNSLAYNISDQKLKTESYYQIAQLEYQREMYLEASAYYDSTLMLLPPTDSRHLKVQKLAGNLKEIASNIQNINYLDTLIYFESLTPDVRKKAIPPYLARNQVNQKPANSGNIVNKNPSGDITPFDFGNSTFFAYNKNNKALGKESFEKVWGRRVLGDDWRRSSRSITSEVDGDNNKIAEASGDKDEIPNVEEYERYLRELPTNPIKKKETNDRIMNAMFNLGKLFRDKIENYTKSASTLQNMHTRFGSTPFEPESWFYLHLDYLDLGNKSKAEEYKNKLIEKYPNSNYKTILANAGKKSEGITDIADQHYKSAYALFESGKYAEAISLLDKSKEVVGDNNKYQAKIMLLKAMCLGGKEGKDAYIRGLNDVLSAYPNTPEHLKAREIMRLLGGDQSAFTTVQDVDKIYQRESDVIHYVVLITYNVEEVKHINLKVAVSEYNKNNYKAERLQLGDATLNIESNTQVILIRKFENEEKALQYAVKAQKDRQEFSGGADYTFDILPISQANYRKMLSERSSVGYRTFYENTIAPQTGNK